MSAGSSSGKRRGHAEEHEEHENHERWLVSYADMMTLLMVLFIVMFAISQVDQQKFAALAAGMRSGFGAEASVVKVGGSGITPDSGTAPMPLDMTGQIGTPQQQPDQAAVQAAISREALRDAEGVADAARAELADLREVEERLRGVLAEQGLSDAVTTEVTERGLVVALVSDDLFFASASARLEAHGREVVDAIEPVLRDVPNDLSVEGHANHLAIRSAAFPSNWELSAARAGSVVRHLQQRGIDPARMTAVGYGDTRPRVPREDPSALEVNRRVDVLVVSGEAPEVRALLPALASAPAAEAAPAPAASDH